MNAAKAYHIRWLHSQRIPSQVQVGNHAMVADEEEPIGKEQKLLVAHVAAWRHLVLKRNELRCFMESLYVMARGLLRLLNAIEFK